MRKRGGGGLMWPLRWIHCCIYQTHAITVHQRTRMTTSLHAMPQSLPSLHVYPTTWRSQAQQKYMHAIHCKNRSQHSNKRRGTHNSTHTHHDVATHVHPPEHLSGSDTDSSSSGTRTAHTAVPYEDIFQKWHLTPTPPHYRWVFAVTWGKAVPMKAHISKLCTVRTGCVQLPHNPNHLAVPKSRQEPKRQTPPKNRNQFLFLVQLLAVAGGVLIFGGDSYCV